MKQLSIANKQFYRRPILTFEQTLDFNDCFIGTACAIGILSRDNYWAMVQELQKAYGQDLFIEIMPHTIFIDGEDIQKVVTDRAVMLHKDQNLQLLATNDSHYTLAEDAITHSVLLKVQYGQTIDDDGWPEVFYMKTMEGMAGDLQKAGVPDDCILNAIVNTQKLAAQVSIEKPEMPVELPSVYDNDEIALQERLQEGWNRKIKSKVGTGAQVYHERLIYELGVIKKMDFIKYFLMVEETIRWSREQGIMVGPARGSSAGSLVCYLIDITQLDPIKHGLYFERFLNPSRIELPDIDVDFQDNRRDEVFQHVVDKYGRDNVGQINTFSILTIKNAFRDVCRVHKIPNMKMNVMSKQIEDENSFDKNPELLAFKKKHPQIIEIATSLTGTIRNNGVHACGVCISNNPLYEVCAMERRKDAVVSNWDKRECENFGLLKMDLLGLTTLTILEHARQLVVEATGSDIDYPNLPLDDERTLAMFKDGDCACVFQFEGAEMQNLLRRLQASDFETITAATALYRPGPLNAGLTAQYAKISAGEDYEQYACPELEPILKETRSVLVYQEQIMRIFNELGGFTWAEADKMRKIMGKKLGKEAFDVHRKHFVDGCESNGIDSHIADHLFDQMIEFAAYGFNKSHAAAYTMISYWCGYMKAHHPAEFMAAYLSSVHSDDHIMNAVNESRRLKIPVERPDINLSTDKFVYDKEDNCIMAPLGAIKGVGEKAVAAILETRADRMFFSAVDFEERLIEKKLKRVVNIRVARNLERAGAFESLGLKEPDEEQREKNYAELLPTFTQTPRLSFDRDEVDEVSLAEVENSINQYADLKKMNPVHAERGGKKPVIFVINGLVKGENRPMSSKGSRLFYTTMKSFGFGKKHTYCASLVKTHYPIPSKAKKECQAAGLELLKKEIKAVKPKLIICFVASMVDHFVSGGKMGKVNGRVVYSKEYECYVLFSYSPQYAYWQEEKAMSQYLQAMNKIPEMFIEAGV
jgi:DNA polymerase-3 subunit alpha